MEEIEGRSKKEEGRNCFKRRNLLRKGFGRFTEKCYLCKSIMERTEEEYYNESRRLREETMLMADALRDNPLCFTITNGITMDAEIQNLKK